MFNSTTPARAGIAIGIALAAVTAGTLAITGSAAPATTHKLPAELRAVIRDVGPGGGADVPPQGDSIGDSDTFTSVASDPKTGQRLGRGEAMCTIVDIAKPGGYGPPPRNATYHCLSISRLHDGQLILAARVHFDADGNQSNAPAAIVGGTGRYAGARGWETSKPLRGGKSLSILHFVR